MRLVEHQAARRRRRSPGCSWRWPAPDRTCRPPAPRCRTRRPCSSRTRPRRASCRRGVTAMSSGIDRLCSWPWRRSRAARQRGVVDVLVQVARRRRSRRVDHGDARLGQVALHGVTAEGARALEAHVVLRVGVRDVDLPLTGLVAMLNSVVPTCGERARSAPAAVGVDREHVLVGQVEPHGRRPRRGRARPPSGRCVVELHDQPDLRRRLAERVGRPARDCRRADRAVGGACTAVR